VSVPTPLALNKAKELYQFAMTQGAPLADFELMLTVEEGFELIDWLPHSGLFGSEHLPTLEGDIELAKQEKNPWVVLDNFVLHGMRITRKDQALQ
jgi:hypothetical protein